MDSRQLTALQPNQMRVDILPYDPTWAENFQEIKSVLENDLSGVSYLDIVHVGSTSIPEMYAKPVIDIDIIVADRPSTQPAIKALEAAGYLYRGEMNVPDRHAISRLPSAPKLPTHNLYITVDGCVSLRNHLGVKKVLLESEELRNEYSKIKQKLGEHEFEHIGVYVHGKTEILQKILSQVDDLTEEEKEEIRMVNVNGVTYVPKISKPILEN
jgi:GrpB-like predicted nucleotidyltransferase (UPF0157 family)